ncbi:hypothetical protein Tco_0577540 [Tanacetum coccineum]|uniref:DUF4283 domain-containing protein n=1 Tax=Tanacetum coccineum TaxID=301880 RepID=A0ABQ5J0A6_9ASTR
MLVRGRGFSVSTSCQDECGFQMEDSAWVEVGGVPFKLWKFTTFIKSASKMGRVLGKFPGEKFIFVLEHRSSSTEETIYSEKVKRKGTENDLRTYWREG